jgi:hypothetical protein
MRRIISIAIVITGLIFGASGLSAQGFGGGPGDGYGSALSAAPPQFTPTGYYDGGAGDGFSTALSANFSYSANRFGGGGYDGYARALSPDNSFSLTRYYGGAGDGYASESNLLIKLQSPSTFPMPGVSNNQQEALSGNNSVLRIWPNPFTEEVNLTFGEVPVTESWVYVYDMTGRELRRIQMQCIDLLILDLRSLPTGSYLLSVQWSQEGLIRREQHRIVKGR